MDQTENNFINNTNTTTPAPQNITLEFYFTSPDGTRIYHVTYTELNLTETARHLNSRIDLSRIPDHQLTYHYNVQHSIRQQIVQRSVIPQSFDTMVIQPISQEYPNDNAYDVSSISPIQQPVDYQQDTPPQQSFETIIVQPTFQEYLDDNTYDATSIPPNSLENT
ncbi:uncharacterized protein OCT59_026911 [Rhizophagus irregularis]|uniref:Uncharacterized protein n=2 Tax=Rhizophagus irregularis TaxID=588596 RepID=U9T7V1_RHIID|nr:hypothetical protein GLOIN_2v1775519 [Rhizophagus irregularis DAOM 181602=DAOM 197198]EXX76882.1 hypothetical protein RirG_028900 [Rhizophagus irregularis DAOM 197198w]UZO06596.1 hypothetical protein OCT59_026911 [Rhizophagus irregularis]POG70783.1 hypothetical protein GLOIN_2v1775519 [Rhizophagus irregularis DAOM 181602=DAOM 197198]CAG8576883.1 8813_t:CDS:1 [Rhizophagus irregularis]GBC22704.1 hypothetical protein GLOIN_2v1775519 [Rhizophagus irregularis DAOM 181602=DAOM 197198]|eukprot:XP_025177649.1 hypothetical protein GLOIN_2v1775519 [Rhizophagus irregularis DAOM 181602=DAOM 197198]